MNLEQQYLKDRAFTALNLKQYAKFNYPDYVRHIKLVPPSERQYILRMLIKRMFGELLIPKELEWAKPMIDACIRHQDTLGITQPFIYLTIRSGIVNTTTDDAWHVDGFSKTITHLPEQNYVWCNNIATEYVVKPFLFPNDFDPLKHNIHNFFQNRIDDNDIKHIEENTIYGFDPYVVHRRPPGTIGKDRCFIRLSFTPIEIEDKNNTLNPYILTNYTRDGIKEMRNNLIPYDAVPAEM